MLPMVPSAVPYWALMGWMAFIWGTTSFDLTSFFLDTETYRRVYLYPERAVSILSVCMALYTVAILAQLAGWRSRRTAPIAVAAVIASFCIDGIVVALGVNPACCGTSWSGPVLQFFL